MDTIEWKMDDNVIELDYEDFCIYRIGDCWYALYYDSEIHEEELLLEDPEQNIFFKGGDVFGTIITEEDFIKFRELK